MTLYDLTDELLNLLELAEDPDADPDALQGSFESVNGLFEEKADGYAKVIRQLNAEADMVDAEIERLKAKRNSLKNNADRIKKSLQAAMIATDKRKFKTPFFTFSIKKNAGSVVMDTTDLSKIPNKYLTYSSPTVNKTPIKQAINAGENLDGVAHLESTESLTIR
jgi:phosphoribosylaminoimidazole carboxylase (NCAIR synthetase)